MIGCLRIPYFEACIEQRDHPALRGVPLAFVEPDGITRMVTGISAEAAAQGVEIGMTLRQAQARCNEIQIALRNPAHTRRERMELLETLSAFTGLVEEELPPAPPRTRGSHPKPAIQDRDGAAVFMLDLGRLPKGSRQAEAIALGHSLCKLVETEHGLRGTLGLAAGRFTARVAASSINRKTKVLIVPFGKNPDFLQNYPVELLPLYPEQAEQLHLLGIRRLGQVASLSPGVLARLFGKSGKRFGQLARGHDESHVAAHVPRLTERLAREFEAPVEDRQIVERVLADLVETLTARLVTRGQAVADLGLAVTLDDHNRLVNDLVLREPSSSAAHIGEIMEEMLAELPIRAAVSKVEVIFSGMVQAQARQLSLFPTETVSQDRLQMVLRTLVALYGPDWFYRIELDNPDARLPEQAFRLSQAAAA
jgi:nucleotidyltransferase/DNA polymerase involved in DNA repair